MKITVFGASGRTGLLFLEKALKEGHEVVAYTRSPEKIPIKHGRLRVLKGTVTDQKMIEQAVVGTDAVVELMGAVNIGTENIISGMKKHHIRRIVAASAISVDDSHDKFNFKRLLLIGFVKMFIPKHVKEVRKAAQFIRASNLDWTLVRIPVLNNKPGSSPIRSGYYGNGAVGTSLSRTELATFIYHELVEGHYIHKAPAISS
ncbi:NAD(P)H-binding protein [Gracilibacillus salitolerans]|uniref:NAD(P)H-binding protein n=1 Tax=Gracilibacillus salitolerans TaxID=2663022 RepID=A0A5Q2TPA5_9BACI|nr:NAD(P)H-binding protein [Gracilibacillus salitolerans]QGH35947.1 NAD(P)H-binding protein [Gracilibacillus salitolerans]